MAHIRANFCSGRLTSGPSGTGAFTMTSADGAGSGTDGLATLPAVTGSDTCYLVFDPDREFGDPEVIRVNTHTAAATTADIQAAGRAQLGTTARSHAVGTKWVLSFLHDVDDATSTPAEVGTASAGTAGAPLAPVDHSHALADDAVTTAKILNSNVTTAKIADGAVTTDKLGADAVTGAKVADDAIDSEHIADGAIDSSHLAADVVDGTKIADDAVDSEHIADGAVLEAAIADGAVTASKLADLLGGTDWEIDADTFTITFSGSGTASTGTISYNKAFTASPILVFGNPTITANTVVTVGRLTNTSSGFTAYGRLDGGASHTGSVTAHYIAVGPTA